MKIKKRYIKAECEYRAKEDSLSYLASEKIMSIFVSTFVFSLSAMILLVFSLFVIFYIYFKINIFLYVYSYYFLIAITVFFYLFFRHYLLRDIYDHVRDAKANDTKIIDDLKEENEILRDHIKKLNNSDYLDVLERENERLRSENWHLQYDRFIRPSFAGDFDDSNDK